MLDDEQGLTAAEFLSIGTEQDGDTTNEIELEVLEENWVATHVFMRCSPQYIAGGMAAPMATGITATEAMAAITGMRIDLEAHPDTFDQVIDMGRHAAQALNERNR